MEKITDKKINKKAQMKIQQMAFMLIAVFIFFALVGMFVLMYKMGDLRETASLLEEKNALLLLSKFANSPEFSCGEAFGNVKTSCVDLDKVMALKQNINTYHNFWEKSNIEIRWIYPAFEEEIKCTTSNYPECNIIDVYSGIEEGIGVSNFVSLCRKDTQEGMIYNKCEIGQLIISYEIK